MASRILLGAVLLGVVPALSAAERLNMKTGLWEITAVTEVSGMPPLPKDVLDKMTPQQRAEMLAELKANGPETDTSRECITEKDLERPFESSDTKECTETIVSATQTTQEVRLTCHGEFKGTGVLRVTAPTPSTMTAMLDMRSGDGKDAFTVKSQMKGHWLSADCGDEADDEESPEE